MLINSLNSWLVLLAKMTTGKNLICVCHWGVSWKNLTPEYSTPSIITKKEKIFYPKLYSGQSFSLTFNWWLGSFVWTNQTTNALNQLTFLPFIIQIFFFFLSQSHNCCWKRENNWEIELTWIIIIKKKKHLLCFCFFSLVMYKNVNEEEFVSPKFGNRDIWTFRKEFFNVNLQLSPFLFDDTSANLGCKVQ